MNKKLITCLLCLSIGASVICMGQTRSSTRSAARKSARTSSQISKNAPGNAKYSIAKLEWLALQLNATAPETGDIRCDAYNTAFVPGGDGRTLGILIGHVPDAVDQGALKMHAESMKKLAKMVAKSKKWDSWLKVKVVHSAISMGEVPLGQMIYSPTKLEWFAMECNATKDDGDLRTDGYAISYSHDRKDTLHMVICYRPDVQREFMNSMIEIRRQQIEEIAKARGWSWFKLKEQHKKLATPPVQDGQAGE